MSEVMNFIVKLKRYTLKIFNVAKTVHHFENMCFSAFTIHQSQFFFVYFGCP